MIYKVSGTCIRIGQISTRILNYMDRAADIDTLDGCRINDYA